VGPVALRLCASVGALRTQIPTSAAAEMCSMQVPRSFQAKLGIGCKARQSNEASDVDSFEPLMHQRSYVCIANEFRSSSVLVDFVSPGKCTPPPFTGRFHGEGQNSPANFEVGGAFMVKRNHE